MANQLIIPLLMPPKQVDFLPLGGSKRSAYQQALARVSDANLFAPPIIMTDNDSHIASRKQAEDMGIAVTVVVEPMRRDSGPAIAAGAAIARTQSSGAIVLAFGLWSITNPAFSSPKKMFLAACRAGRMAAADGKIVTFGICPTEPRAFDEKVESMIVDSHDGTNRIQGGHWYKGARHEWGSLIPTICANVSLRQSKPVIPV